MNWKLLKDDLLKGLLKVLVIAFLICLLVWFVGEPLWALRYYFTQETFTWEAANDAFLESRFYNYFELPMAYVLGIMFLCGVCVAITMGIKDLIKRYSTN
jgi:hypothetical protein